MKNNQWRESPQRVWETYEINYHIDIENICSIQRVRKSILDDVVNIIEQSFCDYKISVREWGDNEFTLNYKIVINGGTSQDIKEIQTRINTVIDNILNNIKECEII